MNTPAHLVIGAAAFARPGRPGVTWAALAGGFLPDLSLFVMVAGAALLGYPTQVIFGRLFYTDGWQAVFAVDNSFVLWGAALALALWRRSPWAVALTGAALLHLAADFPLHGQDARPMFWPLTDWKFLSPLSYWETARGAGWIAPLEKGLVAVLTLWLLLRFRSWRARAGFAALAAAELSPHLIWMWLF